MRAAELDFVISTAVADPEEVQYERRPDGHPCRA